MADADFLKAARSTPVITLSDTEARVDMGKMRAWRLARLRQMIRKAGCGAGIFFDPINLRYATGRRGHSAFGLHILG
jgi:Xaa-Pro aminopeptidase